jgi:hypothetical protein
MEQGFNVFIQKFVIGDIIYFFASIQLIFPIISASPIDKEKGGYSLRESAN